MYKFKIQFIFIEAMSYKNKTMPGCETCKGEGMIYPLVKKDCIMCEGKKITCSNCGACGYVYEIEIKTCEDCQGTGRIAHIALTRG
jgi:DnaJ-class molecular chaperone